jgi:hypothetical protein
VDVRGEGGHDEAPVARIGEDMRSDDGLLLTEGDDAREEEMPRAGKTSGFETGGLWADAAMRGDVFFADALLLASGGRVTPPTRGGRAGLERTETRGMDGRVQEVCALEQRGGTFQKCDLIIWLIA